MSLSSSPDAEPNSSAAPRCVLLSVEAWDGVWRRNQQLASRVPATVFVEPGRPGLGHSVRHEGSVTVLTPPKPMPFRWPGGRELHALLAARLIRRLVGPGAFVTWATHPYQAWLARRMGAPVLYDRTDDWPLMESNPAARSEVARLESELFRLAATVTMVSPAMQTQVPEGALTLPNGVDFQHFAAVDPGRSRSGPVRLAFVGTIDPFRIDFGLLGDLARRPEVDLLLIGPGTPPRGLASAGPVDHQGVPSRLAGCDALLAPYRLDNDVNATADSLKLYEYFATGLPVLATATGGFERYPDLVSYLPTEDLRGAIDRGRDRAQARRAIARTADWSVRARHMREILCAVGRTR